MIEVQLSRIIMRENNDQVVIFLQEKGGERRFPIIIGLFEAMEIKRKVMGVKTPRPLTHDLVRNVLRDLGGELVHVVIDSLKEATFYAKLHVRRNGKVQPIDARSSDAIAIAVAEKIPIYVEEQVLEEVLRTEE